MDGTCLYFGEQQDVIHSESDSDTISQQSNGPNSRRENDDTEELPMHHPRRFPPSNSKAPFREDIAIPPSWQFQIDLADVLGRHRTDLKLYDEIIDLVKTHSDQRQLRFSTENLMRRGVFLKQLENSLGSEAMKPTDIDVELTNKTLATVSVFNLESMILSIINDETLMRSENMAEGYDYLSWRGTNTNNVYW